MSIYLDYNATTPPHEAVVQAISEVLTTSFGNAAAQHRGGRAAARRVRAATEQAAELLGVNPSRLVWTSGATESLNTAIRAATQTHPHIVSAATEHRAVLDVVEHMEANGSAVSWVELDAEGVAHPAALRESLAHVSARATVVLTAANNETGVINDFEQLAAAAHDQDALIVCDATQAAGKIPTGLEVMDFAAASGHKFYGPQGIGVLVVPPGTAASPLIFGGGHQRGWRSGTLNLPGIVGLGEAARLAFETLEAEAWRQERLRDLLEKELESRVGETFVNGRAARRLPNTTNVRLAGVPAEALIARCPDLLFSTGSACTSSVPHPSHVLTGLGLGNQHAEESIRLSLGRATSEQDIYDTVEVLATAADSVRQLMRGSD